MECVGCGATIGKRDEICPYCKTPNAAYEALGPHLDRLLATGMQHMNAGDHPSAIEAFGTLLESEEHFEALTYAAHCWSQLGNHGKAIDMTKRAIAARPGSCVAHFNLARLLDSSGRRDEALAFYRTSRELVGTDASVDTTYLRGELDRILGAPVQE